MVKLSHLRHPFRAAAAAATLLAAQRNVRRLAARGKRHFKNDPRYHLGCVTDGFAPRLIEGGDDTPLLERICRAYAAATERQSRCGQDYSATSWWQAVRQNSLAAVRHALDNHDIESLGKMYRNLFRDRCSNGLIGLHVNMARAYFGESISDLYRHYFLSDALYRIDYWKAETGNLFELCDLAGPGIGNPFGAMIEGTLVTTGSEYQHCYAEKIRRLAASGSALVVEIGGGYGGMAYYLLRDSPEVTYIDFDVPESLALTAYYLLRSFPHSKFFLYGEADLTSDSIKQSKAILMPVCELPKVPAKSVHVTFSSHTIPDLSDHAKVTYLTEVVRMTREFFLTVGFGCDLPGGLGGRQYGSPILVKRRALGWNTHKTMHSFESECLYRIG